LLERIGLRGMLVELGSLVVLAQVGNIRHSTSIENALARRGATRGMVSAEGPDRPTCREFAANFTQRHEDLIRETTTLKNAYGEGLKYTPSGRMGRVTPFLMQCIESLESLEG
jgi:hypothetical protein